MSWFYEMYRNLRANPARERALRRAGRATARRYKWPSSIERVLMPRIVTSE